VTRELPLRIALFGAGPQAQRWAWALARHASLVSGSEARADAVVLGPGTREPLGLARQTLRAGRPVLWACGQLPNPWQLSGLDVLSSPGGAFTRFYDPLQYAGGYALLRRFLRGPEPLWRPLYLRVLGKPGGGGRLDQGVIEALAASQALLDGEAERVASSAARNERGEPVALFLDVQYRGGQVLQVTCSLAERGGQMVAVTPGRTLRVEDDRLRISPLAQGSRERLLEGSARDPVLEEAGRFAKAAADHDGAAGNSERWLSVSAIWWAARESLNRGTSMAVPSAPFTDIETPPFKVIQGGGNVARIGPSRRLTLVAS